MSAVEVQRKSDESCDGAVSAAGVKAGDDAAAVEASDRGLFDFVGKKEEEKCEGEVMASEFDEKVKVSDEKKKHQSLIQKLHKSNSSSSSSSDEEEVGENGEKKKKKKSDVDKTQDKKGFLDKIKEKLPGGGKKAEEVVASPPPTPVVATDCAPTPEAEGKEKKGFLEKIKDKYQDMAPKMEKKMGNEDSSNMCDL